MQVRDLMSKDPIGVRVDAPLAEALDLMIDLTVSGLPVIDETGLVRGVVSEGDLLRRMELGTADQPQHWWERLFKMDEAETYRLTNGRMVSDVMTVPPITIDEGAPLAEAASLMEKHGIRRLPVLSKGQLVGMLTRADFVRALRRFVTPSWEKAVFADEEIKNRITAEMARHRWAVDCSLEVAVEGGHVTLTDSAVTDDDRRAARVAATNVPGVRSVVYNITLVAAYPGEPFQREQPRLG